MSTPITVKEAASRCGVSERTVWRMLKAGKLRATKPNGGAWRIDPDSLPRPQDPVEVGSPQPRPVTGEMSRLVRQIEQQETMTQEVTP